MNRRKVSLAIACVMSLAFGPTSLAAADRRDPLEEDAGLALQMLYQSSPDAGAKAKEAKAILVFPEVVKIGFMFAGGHGEGVLFKDGKVVNHYATTSGSYGFQVGAQRFSYAVFLMTDDAVNYLERSKGWEIGAGPSITMIDHGHSKKISSTTMNTDAYAFVFGQRGLMAGVGIEGSKISLIDR